MESGKPIDNPAPQAPEIDQESVSGDEEASNSFNKKDIDPTETWPDEPLRLHENHVDSLLLWCVSQDSSDITFQTDRPVYNDIHGALHPGMKRALDGADIAVVLTKIYGADAMARLASGIDLDLSYEIRPDRESSIRFRVNITPILSRGRDAVQITMRTLPDIPPTMEELQIEQEIIDNWAPKDGLVLVTGGTGSGKSTLLAAGNRMMVERPEGCGKMLTYEAPIEFTYDKISGPTSLIAQTEIPRHLKSFEAGVRNALRRKPNIILVGESRDRETIAAAIEAAQTGHAVYTTVHTNGVAATIRRMVVAFDHSERNERAYSLMESMRLIVTQTLLPRIGGGRVGLREWLVFDDELREKFLSMDHEKWVIELLKILPERGRTMVQSAKMAYDEGLIEKRHYMLIAKGSGEENV